MQVTRRSYTADNCVHYFTDKKFSAKASNFFFSFGFLTPKPPKGGIESENVSNSFLKWAVETSH